MKKIVIDLGGTHIKWAVIKESTILEKGKENTEAFTLKARGVIKRIANICNKILESGRYTNEISGVVISMPGAIDTKNMRTLVPLNFIPDVEEINIREEFNKHCSLKVNAINDANAAALGEYTFGSLKGAKNSVLVTLGTGIGAGVIINGKIYNGHNFAAGEVGQHKVKNMNWENIASTRWLVIISNFVKGTEKLNGEQIFSLIESDHEIRKEYENWLENIALGIVNINMILSPEKIAIGGGVSENELFSIDRIQTLVNELTPIKFEKPTRLVKASLGNEAALLGASTVI